MENNAGEKNYKERGVPLKYKLLIYMMVSVVFFAVVLFIGNAFFVERYYLYQKEKSILNAREQVVAIIAECQRDAQGNLIFTEEQSQELFRIGNAAGQTILIRVGDTQLLSPSMSIDLEAKPTQKPLEKPEEKMPEGSIKSDDGQMDVVIMEGVQGAAGESASQKPEESIREARQSLVIHRNPWNSVDVLEGNVRYRMRNDLAFNGETIMQTEDYSAENVSIGITSMIAADEMLEDDSGNEMKLLKNTALGINIVQYQSRVEDDIYLYISMPMSSISEGAAISNQFVTMLGLVTALFTIGWAFFISHRFTRPIAEISRITTKMQSLDFSEEIHYKAKDELGVLSENVNDLSETLSRTIDALNEKNAELAADIDKERKIDKMRRGFISNVSHELKTPIFLIQGYADGLKTAIVSDERKRSFYCDVINEEAEKMGVLVQDLLTIARLEAGEGVLDERIGDIGELTQGIAQKYELAVQEKGISLSKDIKSGLYASFDSVKMEQVITNFINNAIEHVDNKKRVNIQAVQDGAYIKVAVFNSGRHIDGEHLENIWNSFYKADAARTRELGGAGLGLSIARATLEAHGCAYGAENCQDGVEFWFRIKEREKRKEKR